jgi:tetratricopeptide (TPR) repeat protein
LKAEHLDELDTLILLAPEDPEYLVRRAKIFEAAGEHQKALADLDQAIARDADRNDFFHARAMVLLNLGERAKAIEDESRAMALAPFAAIHHGWRGTFRLYEEGPSEEAEADVVRGVELAPEDLVMLYLLAGYLAEVGHHEEAVRVHDRRVALYPSYGFVYAGRGNFSREVGNLAPISVKIRNLTQRRKDAEAQKDAEDKNPFLDSLFPRLYVCLAPLRQFSFRSANPGAFAGFSQIGGPAAAGAAGRGPKRFLLAAGSGWSLALTGSPEGGRGISSSASRRARRRGRRRDWRRRPPGRGR